MKITVSVHIQAGDDAPAEAREVFALERGALAPGTVGLRLDEAKDLLAAVQEKVVAGQAGAALAETATCPRCGAAHRHKDSRDIVVRTLFGTLRLPSPRWWQCPCSPGEMRTFSPLAALLPDRVTPELSCLEAKFAGLASYGISARLLAEILPLGRRLHATAVRIHAQAVTQRLKTRWGLSSGTSSRAARGTGRSCPARTCPWSSPWTAASSTPASSVPALTAGSR